MNAFIIAIGCVAVFFVWYAFNAHKLKARTERIRRVQVHGPDARICYMTKMGKRYVWQISIESVEPKGRDWVITAWCHEKNDFLIFYASRMYEYFDLNRFQEITNVPAYFTERFSHKPKRRSA